MKLGETGNGTPPPRLILSIPTIRFGAAPHCHAWASDLPRIGYTDPRLVSSRAPNHVHNRWISFNPHVSWPLLPLLPFFLRNHSLVEVEERRLNIWSHNHGETDIREKTSLRLAR